MGVLCLGVCFSWLTRGGVAITAGPIRSHSFGRVKLNGISKERKVSKNVTSISFEEKCTYNLTFESVRHNNDVLS